MSFFSCMTADQPAAVESPDSIVVNTIQFMEENNYDAIRRAYFKYGEDFFNLPLNNSGFTVLLLAALEHRTELVKMILKSQSCPAELLKQTDKFQNTALHLAMYGSSTELIQLLLDAGVDAEVRNKQGETPWELARNIHNQTVMQSFPAFFPEQIAVQSTLADTLPCSQSAEVLIDDCDLPELRGDEEGEKVDVQRFVLNRVITKGSKSRVAASSDGS
eukprot:TRINITY_DN617_c0_g1_i12.p1 TRINITY_DN617_c0_g1~~TRINITY_DN617_c0_g1_i12.p1  ORF type:complete len:218 (-),score=44.31 TRINITY_DN617_c0_g1_i12:185-838(-)